MRASAKVSDPDRDAGLSASFLCDFELGKRQIGLDTADAVARVLDIQLGSLAGPNPAAAHNGPEIDLPRSLLRFAVDSGVSVRHMVSLYWLQRTIMANRSRADRVNLEEVDWLRFYNSVKEFL